MTKTEYLALVTNELTNLGQIIQDKGADYSGGDEDPFSNFRVTEKLGLAPAEIGVLVRLVDKIQRIRSFLKNGELKVKGESAIDAARDICGYSLILIGLLNERKDNEE